MTPIIFLYAFIIATGAMTTFSSIWSKIVQKQFREPVLLSKIFTKDSASSITNHPVLGWVLHLIFGALFLMLYELLWWVTGLERTLLWSFIFGALMGLIGIVGWVIMFHFYKYLPKLNYTHYFVHLFFAHIVFSVTALMVYVWFN